MREASTLPQPRPFGLRAIRLIWLCALLGCTREVPPPTPRTNAATGSSSATSKSAASKIAPNDAQRVRSVGYARWSDVELERKFGLEIEAFCSRCHAMPTASEAPREAWADEVKQAFSFHAKSPARQEPTPDREAVVEYFARKATPYKDFASPPRGDDDPGKLKFVKSEIRIAGAPPSPALAGLTWLAPQQDRLGALLACDMRSGGLYSLAPDREPEVLVAPKSTALANPCHVEPCDLDGDGLSDLVVADLGLFLPDDHRFGAVVWLRRVSDGGVFEEIKLGGPLARVADVRPGDFDADGDQDLVVAEFGYHETGRILLLENQLRETGAAKFDLRELDPRHGAIHVPVADLNGDGRLDFVALIGQEHEVIEAFLNAGDGTFEKQRIYTAPNPSWASSGIQLLDLDADGDLDVLNSNGDSFDRGYLKPYHALRWLENRGEFPWVEHHLADIPGCQCAVAGDLDRDGDLDLVAVALLPQSVLDWFGKEHFDSVCWFEQTAQRQFHRRTLETGDCHHAAVTLLDFDGDGALDLAVSNFQILQGTAGAPLPYLTIWRNDLPNRPGREQESQ